MRPTDFAAQLNVSLANGWGIVRTVTDMCMKMPEGKYVLVKDPNKVRTASLPIAALLERHGFRSSLLFVDAFLLTDAICSSLSFVYTLCP